MRADLVCTAVYPQIARKMAMKIDGKFDFRWVTSGKIIHARIRQLKHLPK